MALAVDSGHHWCWLEEPQLSSHLGLLGYLFYQHSAERGVLQYSRLQAYALYKLYSIHKGESQRRVQCLRAT